jgi:hypothetical protein
MILDMTDARAEAPSGFYETQYETKLAHPGSVEALFWLQRPDGVFRIFGDNGIRAGFSGKRAVDFVQRLYRRGARAVTAVSVHRLQADWVRQEAVRRGQEETDVIEVTDTLIVELPDDPQERAQLIGQWVSTFGRRKWDVPSDSGQRYLLFWWD